MKRRRSIGVDYPGQDELEEELGRAPTKKKKKRPSLAKDAVEELVEERREKTKENARRERREERKRTKATDEKPVRKKKTAGELIVAGKSDQVAKKLMRFEKNANEVAKRIQSTELEVITPSQNVGENEFQEEYRNMFGQLKFFIEKLSRTMEAHDNINQKDVYALVSMYSHLRETMADMRSMKDVSAISQEIADEVLDPFGRSSAEELISLYGKAIRSVSAHISKIAPELVPVLKTEIETAAQEAGFALSQHMAAAKQKVIRVLSGAK